MVDKALPDHRQGQWHYNLGTNHQQVDGHIHQTWQMRENRCFHRHDQK